MAVVSVADAVCTSQLLRRMKYATRMPQDAIDLEGSGYIASCQALKILRAMLLESGSSSKNGAHCGPISSEAGQKRGEGGGGVPTKACPLLMTNAFTINVQMSANMAAEHGQLSSARVCIQLRLESP